MTFPKDKKARERYVLDGFLQRLAIDVDEIEPADPPDFLLTIGDRRVGIELVRLYQPHAPSADLPPQAREGYQDQVVASACQIHAAKGGPPLVVSVRWLDRSGPDKKTAPALAKWLAQQALNLAPQMSDSFELERDWAKSDDDFPSSIHNISVLRPPSITKPHWSSLRAGFEMEFGPDEIQQIVDQKGSKIAQYRAGCKEAWLLMYPEGHAPSSFIDLSTECRAGQFRSQFDRLFVYFNFGGGVTELAVKR